jgi:hypothetical protein
MEEVMTFFRYYPHASRKGRNCEKSQEGQSDFPHDLINGTIFGKKLLNIKCDF